jgi:7-carboxy-7-deazaguanine synthase
MTDKLAVNEIFGVTFQGEGKSIGMPCFFLRLSGCNQHCIWCDTPYTWRFSDRYPHNGNRVYDAKEETHVMTANDALDKLLALQQDADDPARALPVKNLVISGGEPMLQQEALMPLINVLKSQGWWVEIETAGTIPIQPQFYVDQFNVSLKLKNSGNPVELRRNEKAITSFRNFLHATFKFVVCDLDDLIEIDELVETFILPPRRVYIMPEGTDAVSIQSHAQAVAEETIRRGFNLTTRMHIQLYGNQRAI